MCWECFTKYTDAPVWNNRVAAVAAKIAYADERYGEVDSSPLLHAIVADMNVDDERFEYDLVDPPDIVLDADPWEQAIFWELADLSVEERATAVATHWGFIDQHGRVRQDIDDEQSRHREYRILRADAYGQFTVHADLVQTGPRMPDGYAVVNGGKVYIVGELDLATETPPESDSLPG